MLSKKFDLPRQTEIMPIRPSFKELLSKMAWHTYHIFHKGVHYRSQLSQTFTLLNASRGTIEAFQRVHLERLIRHAYYTTPYYRELLKTGSQDITLIPPLEKQNIRDDLERLCSDHFTEQERVKNATSGSTGTPLTFYQGRYYWNQRNLSVYYFNQWAGWNLGGSQLIISGAPAHLRGDEDWKHHLNNFWRNRYHLNGFYLTDEEMQATFERMNGCYPQIILSYPSSLYQFATFLYENALTPRWGLKGIISSAEMLHPHYRSFAEHVFGTKVYNRYSGREVGLIAMECAEGRMHINSRDIYLEIDSPNPYTQPGEILITQLNNYVMPFIRYRMGDIGILSDEICPCGNQLPILRDLLGRTTTTFRTRAGRLIHGGYFTQQFYNIEGVSQFQIIQESLKHYVLKLVINKRWVESSRLDFIYGIQRALGHGVVVTIEFVKDIPVPPSGKREFTISKVTAPTA